MIGTLLDNRYQVLHSLGSGGFGETFLAKDIKMPSQKYCVIKQLKPINNNPQAYQTVKERFQREAAILEILGNGSNQIPRLYAYFESESKFYLIQEWIDGDTLSKKISQDGLFTQDKVKQILLDILPILDYVHNNAQTGHIIHRDIKPENIILRNHDQKPVLIDFGAVKESMGTMAVTSNNLTRSIIVGTPGFMPPEQAIGRPVYSSDLYALGLTAIYLLTGKLPQDLETDQETGEVLWQQQLLGKSCLFAEILDKVVRINARDRYSKARDMLIALQATSVNPSVSIPTTTVSSPDENIPSKTNLTSPQTTLLSTKPKLNNWRKVGITALATISVLSIFTAYITGSFKNFASLSGNKTSEDVEGIISQRGDSVSKEDNELEGNVGIPLPSFPLPRNNVSISKDDAVSLVKQWQSSKGEIFAPPYNTSLGTELLTGNAYEEKMTKPVNWLRNNDAYYTYSKQSIGEVESFSRQDNQVSIDVVVSEERIYHQNNQPFYKSENTAYEVLLVRYVLKPSNGKWKIYDYTTLRNLEKRDLLFKNSTPKVAISQNEAVSLVKKWQNAKNQIFAPPYNRSLGYGILTGKAYEKKMREPSSWLENNNAYYTYSNQSTGRVDKFVPGSDKTVLDIVITEQRVYHQNGEAKYSDKNTSYDTRLVRYILEFEQNKWKISDYITINKIDSKSISRTGNTVTGNNGNTTISVSISQNEAVNLVNRWQSLKSQIFAPPYNRSLAYGILTGNAYEKKMREPSNWLENNNAYYTYRNQSIDRVEKFAINGNQITLDIVITEQRIYHQNGEAKYSDKSTAYDTRLVRYILKRENETWKISNYYSLKTINQR